MKSENTQLWPKGEEKEGTLVMLLDVLDRGQGPTLPRIRQNERFGGRAARTTAHCRTPQSRETKEGEEAARDDKLFFFFFGEWVFTCNSRIYWLVAARLSKTSLTCFPLQLLSHPRFPVNPLLIPNGAHQTGIPTIHPSLLPMAVN